MNFFFEITTMPSIEDRRYIVSYLEGTLKLQVGDRLFFDQKDIPLLEFAICIKKWLLEKIDVLNASFAFDSMDYEDPILVFTFVNENFYKIDSIWKKIEQPIKVASNELITASVAYLDDFQKQLSLNYGLELGMLHPVFA